MFAGEEQSLVASPPVIQQSWRRCLAHGLTTSDPARQDPLASSELSLRRDQNYTLLQLASSELDLLGRSMSAGGIVLLANSEGVILDARGDPDFMGRARRVSLQPGAVWSERREGTNAIGTALMEHRLVQVRGDEHFLEDNRFLICTAIPVMSPGGELAGIIDLSGDARRPPAHCEMLVRLAAVNIEHAWTRQTEGHDLLVAFHAHPSSLGTPYEGVVAFREGVLIGACQVALHLLGLARGSINQLHWSDIFCGSPNSNQKELYLRRGGTPLYARIERPSASTTTKARSERPAITLLEDGVWDADSLALLARAERAMRANIPILLQGETGTGKEVLVRTLHRRTMPPAAPLVAVNCAAIPEGLLEAELFGYQEGAFTGARRGGSRGHIRQADGGTLFLDEIGDMPAAPQSRLLRVLQDAEVIPLGGGRPVKVSFRLVAATHRDLKAAVDSGTFRADLYYRLRHMVLSLSPLRERTNLPEIVDALLEKLGAAKRGISLSAEARSALLRHTWPGNLRELFNLLHTLVSLSEDHAVIGVDALPADLAKGPPPTRRQDGESRTSEAITRVIEQNRGNISAAARQLGVHRSTLYRWLPAAGSDQQKA